MLRVLRGLSEQTSEVDRGANEREVKEQVQELLSAFPIYSNS